MVQRRGRPTAQIVLSDEEREVQLGGAAVHRQLGFESPDSLAGRHQLGLLRRGETRLEPAIDSVLATPVVDRLVTDPEILGDLRDLAAGLDQIQHPPTELRRIATLPHAVLLQDSSIRVQLRDSTKAPADHSLYETRGRFNRATGSSDRAPRTCFAEFGSTGSREPPSPAP
jgi:hypothetical protein